MINIDTFFEFRKGVLFIRIKGVLNVDTASTYIDDVICFIKKNNVINVNINLERIDKIDDLGIHLLNKTNELIQSYGGTMMISNINIKIPEKINKNIIILDSELEAFI